MVDGALTESGQQMHGDVEDLTDKLALAPFSKAMSDDSVDGLIAKLTPAAVAVSSSGVLPFPNPIGLAPLTDSDSVPSA